MNPHVCPKCNGWKQVQDPSPVAVQLRYLPCPICNGAGVLWKFDFDLDTRFKCAGCGARFTGTHTCPTQQTTTGISL